MLFFLCIVLLAIATTCIPLIVRCVILQFPDTAIQLGSTYLPIVAGMLMVISTQLPPIHISNTTTFQQHFVGGGMYSACLYMYMKQLLGWRLHWVVDTLALFAWVSAFGVANKLVEFALLELGLAHIYTGDAYWDLLANTLGGFVGYGIIVLAYRLFSRQRSSTGLR